MWVSNQIVNSEINLNQLVDGGSNQKYALSINNEAADAELKRKMTYYLFFFALLIVGVVFAGCVYTFSTGAVDDKKWAAGIVSAIASGLIGFLVGQGKK